MIKLWFLRWAAFKQPLDVGNGMAHLEEAHKDNTSDYDIQVFRLPISTEESDAPITAKRIVSEIIGTAYEGSNYIDEQLERLARQGTVFLIRAIIYIGIFKALSAVVVGVLSAVFSELKDFFDEAKALFVSIRDCFEAAVVPVLFIVGIVAVVRVYSYSSDKTQ